MRTSASMSARIVFRLVMVAERRGVDARAACQRVGIDAAVLDDVDARVDAERYYDLWAELVTALPDASTFALEVAASASESHNLLRSLCMSCATVGEALTRASRYLRVLTNSVSWPLSQAGDLVVVGLERSTPPRPEHRYADELGVSEILHVGRLFTGVEWAPRAVRFAHSAPANTRPLEAFLRAPLTFSAARTELVIDAASLALPLRRADPAAADFFRSVADKLLRADDGTRPRSIVEDVQTLLRAELSDGTPTLERVAAKLGCSPRTLRRRIATADTTFHDILNELRLSLAREHVLRGALSLAEIGFLLGFSEPSAFHRAFRRWTGTTPRDYAAQHRGSR